MKEFNENFQNILLEPKEIFIKNINLEVDLILNEVFQKREIVGFLYRIPPQGNRLMPITTAEVFCYGSLTSVLPIPSICIATMP